MLYYNSALTGWHYLGGLAGRHANIAIVNTASTKDLYRHYRTLMTR